MATTSGLKESDVELPWAGEASIHEICPFGSIQEWIGKIGKKIFMKRYDTFVPPAVDKVLRFLRYLVLVWVSYMTIVTGKLVFEAVDPYYALFNFWRSEVALSGLVILAVVLVLSLFVDVSTAGRVRDHQCIACLKCGSEAACPVAATVELAAGLPGPSDIRGSYTWADVAKAFEIPVESVIGTDSVRLFPALYAGLPYETEGSTILPVTAIGILAKEGKGDKALIAAPAVLSVAGFFSATRPQGSHS
jgi:hypothetical protein